MSAPASSKCVAKLCLRVWGVTFFFIPAFLAAYYLLNCSFIMSFTSFRNQTIQSFWFHTWIKLFQLPWRKLLFLFSPLVCLMCIKSLSKSISSATQISYLTQTQTSVVKQSQNNFVFYVSCNFEKLFELLFFLLRTTGNFLFWFCQW